MRKLSFSLVALLAVVFAVASAFTSAPANAPAIDEYVVLMVPSGSQPPSGSEDDPEWFEAQSFQVADEKQGQEFSQAERDALYELHCAPSSQICLVIIKFDDEVLDAVYLVVIFGTLQ